MRNRPSVDASPDAVSAIDAVLDRFGADALRVAASAGVRLVHLRGSEAYRDRSRAVQARCQRRRFPQPVMTA